MRGLTLKYSQHRCVPLIVFFFRSGKSQCDLLALALVVTVTVAVVVVCVAVCSNSLTYVRAFEILERHCRVAVDFSAELDAMRELTRSGREREREKEKAKEKAKRAQGSDGPDAEHSLARCDLVDGMRRSRLVLFG